MRAAIKAMNMETRKDEIRKLGWESQEFRPIGLPSVLNVLGAIAVAHMNLRKGQHLYMNANLDCVCAIFRNGKQVGLCAITLRCSVCWMTPGKIGTWGPHHNKHGYLGVEKCYVYGLWDIS